MKVGLYSDLSRQYIYTGHTLIEHKKHTNSADDIRQCRQNIIDLAENSDPNMIKIYRTHDFLNICNCRVLLSNTKEHRFSLAKIDTTLEKLLLRFIGFEIHGKDVLGEFKSQYPQRLGMRSKAITPIHLVQFISFGFRKFKIQRHVQPPFLRNFSILRHFETLRLCCFKVRANICPPVPSATKYKSFVLIGCNTASIDLRPALEIGVGGSP